MKIFSDGGGVQSYTILCMIHAGLLEKPDVIFHANMGVLEAHLRDFRESHVMPKINNLGVRYVEHQAKLYEELLDGYVTTPFWFQNGEGKPSLVARRSCTSRHKVDACNAIIPKRAWATVWLGISADELRRVRDDDVRLSWGRMRTNRYPLIEAGMTRSDCIDYLTSIGEVVPEKSSCSICPFSSRARILKFAQDSRYRELVAKIEDAWHRSSKNKHKYLTPFLGHLSNDDEHGEDNSGTCGVCEF